MTSLLLLEDKVVVLVGSNAKVSSKDSGRESCREVVVVVVVAVAVGLSVVLEVEVVSVEVEISPSLWIIVMGFEGVKLMNFIHPYQSKSKTITFCSFDKFTMLNG